MLKRLALLAGAAAGAGAWWQSRATARDAGRYPAPGRLIDVGGFRLHCYETGAGEPTVVIGGGLGTSVAWSDVTAGVGGFTRAFTYDRAGYGWSDPSPAPRTCTVMAAELHQLLHAAGVGGPYVVVGASAATLIARAFACAHPDEVAGVVLIDPVVIPSVHLDESGLTLPQKVGARGLNGSAPPAAVARVLPPVFTALASVGLCRLALNAGAVPGAISGPLGAMPPESRPIVEAQTTATNWWRAVGREVADGAESFEQLRTMSDPFPDVPLTVITGDTPGFSPPGEVSGAALDALRDWSVRAGQSLAGLSPQGRHVVATDSNHSVIFYRSDVVVDEVRKIVEAARSPSGRS